MLLQTWLDLVLLQSTMNVALGASVQHSSFSLANALNVQAISCVADRSVVVFIDCVLLS